MKCIACQIEFEPWYPVCADCDSKITDAFAEVRRLTADVAAKDAQIEQLREALEELADVVDDWVDGIYIPDSFTTQTARTALAATAPEKGEK